MKIKIIAAIDENFAIGKGGDQLAYLSHDLKRFKALTLNSTIVMGRKTFEALPKGALPQRRNIVLTRNTEYKAPGAAVVHSIAELVKYAMNGEDLFVIGGGEIYSIFIELADELYLTRINHGFKDADTHFPIINMSEWEEVERDGLHECDNSKLVYWYQTLKRK